MAPTLNPSPLKPIRLPLLFGIDQALAIPDGFFYTLDCALARDQGFCAGHIGGCGGCGASCGGDGDGGCGGGGCGGD